MSNSLNASALFFLQPKPGYQSDLEDQTSSTNTESESRSVKIEEKKLSGLIDLNPCSNYLSNLRSKIVKNSSRQFINPSKKSLGGNLEQLENSEVGKGGGSKNFSVNHNRFQCLRNHFTKIESQSSSDETNQAVLEVDLNLQQTESGADLDGHSEVVSSSVKLEIE